MAEVSKNRLKLFYKIFIKFYKKEGEKFFIANINSEN